MEQLPRELLFHIIEDIQAIDLLSSGHKLMIGLSLPRANMLLALSMVSRQLRAVALPYLFETLRLELRGLKRLDDYKHWMSVFQLKSELQTFGYIVNLEILSDDFSVLKQQDMKLLCTVIPLIKSLQTLDFPRLSLSVYGARIVRAVQSHGSIRVASFAAISLFHQQYLLKLVPIMDKIVVRQIRVRTVEDDSPELIDRWLRSGIMFLSLLERIPESAVEASKDRSHLTKWSGTTIRGIRELNFTSVPLIFTDTGKSLPEDPNLLSFVSRHPSMRRITVTLTRHNSKYTDLHWMSPTAPALAGRLYFNLSEAQYTREDAETTSFQCISAKFHVALPGNATPQEGDITSTLVHIGQCLPNLAVLSLSLCPRVGTLKSIGSFGQAFISGSFRAWRSLTTLELDYFKYPAIETPDNVPGTKVVTLPGGASHLLKNDPLTFPVLHYSYRLYEAMKSLEMIRHSRIRIGSEIYEEGRCCVVYRRAEKVERVQERLESDVGGVYFGFSWPIV